DVFINDGSLARELTFLGGSDDDIFINNGSATRDLVFVGDLGADVLANTGVDVTGLEFTGGADDDVLISDGPRLTNLVFNGDDGLDALLINQGAFGSSDLVFNGGADDDLLINDASEISRLTFVGDTGVDGLQNNGFQVESLTFEGGADNDVFISIGNQLSDLLFVGGADDDTLQDSGFEVEDLDFRGDDGADVFLTNGQIESLQFTGGADDDVLQIASGIVQTVVFSGDTGADTLVNGGDIVTLTFNGGADDDILQNNGNIESVLTFNGGADNDVFISNGNEVAELIFSGDEGADTLINNAQFVGRLVFNGDLGADVLRIQTGAIEELEFNGGADSDALKYSGDSSTGQVTFNGEEGNDLLSWDGNALSLNFDGGAGDDIGFILGDGSLLFDGGAGDDLIKIIGNPTADLTVGESFSGTTDESSDTIDFASFTGGALNLDLRSDSDQPQSSSFSLKVLDANGLENVIGTPQADTIQGNARNNNLSGADFADPFTGLVIPKRSDVQWVYLDFDSETNRGQLEDGTQDDGEFVYDQDARDEIEATIEAVYRGPDSDDPWFDVRVVQQIDDIPQENRDAGSFATIFFNQTPDFGRPGGLASEIDLGNQDLSGIAQVQVNGLLGGVLTQSDFVPTGPNAGGGHGGGCMCPSCCASRDAMGYGHSHGNGGDSLKDVGLSVSDTEFGARKPEASRENYITLSAKIAAHELGHLLGLRHADSFGPIGFGLHDPPGGSGYRPAFTGPSGAFETFNHILGSPASVGSTRFDDLQDLFFGEREAVKLTYAFSDPNATTVSDAGTNLSFSTAQPLQLVTTAVPNTLSRGVNAEKELFVQMLGVNGRIELRSDHATVASSNDWYSFQGVAGELINIDVMSNSLARFGSAPDDFVDTIVNVWYEVNGQLELVPYYSGFATNDDIFEPTDSSIIDLILPTDTTYYIEVDTFSRNSEDESFEAAIDIRDDLIERRDDNDASNDLSEAENNALERLIDTIEDQDVGQYQLFIFKYRDANIADGIDNIKGNGGTDEIDGGPGDNFELTFSVGEDIGPINEGQSISRDIQLLDRAATEWSLSTVDYGDGTGVQPLAVDSLGNFTLSHQYTDNGEFTVTVTIRNDIGTIQAQSFDVFVENVDPTITTNSDSVRVDEGQTASVSGVFGDAGSDELEVTADFGDVQFDSITGQWNWSYDSTDDLVRTVTITVTDDDGGSAFDIFDLTVDNVAPAVAVSNGVVTIDEGTVATNSGVFSDAGTDTVTITTNLGIVTQDNASGSWAWSYEGIDDLTDTVTITATDDGGLFQTISFLLTVNNLAPVVASTNASVTTDEGTTATNSGTFGDVTSDTVEITSNRGVVTQDNTNGSWSWSYDATDDFFGTVTITATDDDGMASSTTFDLTVNNVAPTGTLVTPNSANEGTDINVSLAELVDPSADDLSSLRFSFANDVSALASNYAEASNSPTASIPAIDEGATLVFARVFDKDGGINDYSTQVAVLNVDPTIESVSRFGFLLVGEEVQFAAAASDFGINDTLDFSWQFGDGNDATGASVQHIYTAAGTYEVTLTVNDGDDGSAVSTLEVDVILPQESSTEGALFTKTVPFVGDPSTAWTAIINYGDGTSPETINVDPDVGILLNHVFDQDSSDQTDGVFPISIQLSNDQGQQLNTTFNASVINLRPSDLGFSVTGAPVDGQNLSFLGTAFDVPADLLAYEWSFGDGATATGQTVDHIYQVAGIYAVSLTVSDDDESVGFTKSITIEVANQGAPIVSISTPTDGVRNEESTFVLSAFDPDGATEFTYEVNWGDGTSDTFTGQSPLEVTHTYTKVATDGRFEISVTASDGELTGEATATDFGVLGWSIVPDPANPGDQVLVVVGSEGNDSILVWDFWGDWFKVKIRDRTDHVRYRGLTNGDVESILVFGHDGNDRVDIGWSLLPATILGGSGNDLLRGGWGNDIILGNSGNDKIFGEWGRDILIGGTGADRIHGDQQDDILIAGFTAFDEEFHRFADPEIYAADRFLSFTEQRIALESIMAEWASHKSYHTRRHNLLGNTNNHRENDFFLRHNEADSVNNTVFDDDAVDTLWGNGGIDWFFASEEDRVRDKRRWEAEAELDRWWE
ncbi:MAG: PKD domain-containing protein, partial [Planctomycetota bacterium]